MATFGEIRNLVLTSVGRDDADATLIVDAAINYSLLMASLTFQPVEMMKTSAIMLNNGSESLWLPNVVIDADYDESSFSGLFEIDDAGDLMPIGEDTLLLTNLLDIIKLYNKTTSAKMDFIPYEMWDLLVPVDLNYPKYWTLFGSRLIVGAPPAEDTKITISYTTYPNLLTSSEEELPFSSFDSYIVSTSAAITFAAFEETDSASLWNNIASMVAEPANLSERAKAIIEGQKTLIEKAVS